MLEEASDEIEIQSLISKDDKIQPAVIGDHAVRSDLTHQDTWLGIKILSNSAEDARNLVAGLSQIPPQQLQPLMQADRFQQQLQLVGEQANITGNVNIVRQSTGLEIHLITDDQTDTLTVLLDQRFERQLAAIESFLRKCFEDYLLGATSIQPANSRPRLIEFGNMPHYLEDFTGRIDQLKGLRAHLLTHNIGVIIPRITGMGGIGKTSLARQFVADLFGAEDNTKIAPTYTLVAWIDASAQTLYDNYYQLGVALGLSFERTDHQSAIIAKIQRRLAQEKRVLLVFDNAEEEDTLADYIPQKELFPPSSSSQSCYCHCLVTSRHQQWSEDHQVILQEFTEREAVDYIGKKLEKIERVESEDSMKVLAERLACLPLALAHA